MSTLLLGGENRTVEMEVESFGGTYLVSCTPIVGTDGVMEAVMHVAVDVSVRKRVEHELSQYRQHLESMVLERTSRLEEANHELESFSYSVSHDLRAPLRHVAGYLGILEEEYGGMLADKGRECIRRASRSVVKMGELIDDLLNLSRFSRAIVNPRQQSLDGVMADVAAQLQEELRGVRLLVAPDMTIHGDPALLRVMLVNLVENGCKYSSTADDPCIEVGMEVRDGEEVYFVRDNGVGFDMAHAPKLFVPFERLHRADDFPGNGIGLASVQRIISRHGGRIWAEAAPGKGATFFFTTGSVESQADGEKARERLH